MSLDEALRAVVHHPFDDAPRLAYAHAVEATDPARAEFIRLDIGLATTYDAEARERTDVLLAINGDRWLRDLVGAEDHVERRFRTCWCKGFVEIVSAPADVLLRSTSLVERTPLLEVGVSKTASGRDLAQVFTAFPEVRSWGCTSLDLVNDDVVQFLRAVPKHLTVLDLSDNHLTNKALHALIAADLPHLQWVGFRGNPADHPRPGPRDWDGTGTPSHWPAEFEPWQSKPEWLARMAYEEQRFDYLDYREMLRP